MWVTTLAILDLFGRRRQCWVGWGPGARLRRMCETRDLVRTERLALVDDLEHLTAAEWATPSLCRGWTVQDVAAHLAWASALPPGELLAGLARAGFRPNKFGADSAIAWSSRGTPAILDQLRANAATDAKPPGMPWRAALADAVIHGLDIRRPLAQPRPIPREVFAQVADFCSAARWPTSAMLGGSVRRRIGGLRLVADGMHWTRGQGPEARGSAAAMLLVLSGRPVAADELTGPGADTLVARL